MNACFCDECGAQLDLVPGPEPVPRGPCPSCEGTRRTYHLDAHDSITFHEYIGVKVTPTNRHKNLPERGVTRSYAGVRRGRDGWLVERRALYDPREDIARERVVDVATGEVIVDKSESMKEKYRREGRR